MQNDFILKVVVAVFEIAKSNLKSQKYSEESTSLET